MASLVKIISGRSYQELESKVNEFIEAHDPNILNITYQDGQGIHGCSVCIYYKVKRS